MLVSHDRVPPGQTVTDQFPVLHYGPVLHIDRESWRFRLHGRVAKEKDLAWDDFRALPRTKMECDIHCVTYWSKLGTRWEGVAGSVVAKLARPHGDARFAIVQGYGGFETNLPLADLTAEGVLFADTFDGQDISAEHGGPVRLVVPHLYFWKSAKWVSGVEFTATERPGFWEKAGYHMHGDPWKEERYRDETPPPDRPPLPGGSGATENGNG